MNGGPAGKKTMDQADSSDGPSSIRMGMAKHAMPMAISDVLNSKSQIVNRGSFIPSFYWQPRQTLVVVRPSSRTRSLDRCFPDGLLHTIGREPSLREIMFDSLPFIDR